MGKATCCSRSSDFTVVGAGPAGSHMGCALARAGYNVTIFERNSRGRNKPCGGLVSPVLRDRLGTGGRKLFAWPLRGTIVFSTGANSIIFDSKRIKTYAMFRFELDTYMSDCAVMHGAVLHEGTRIENIKYTPGHVQVRSRVGDRVKSKLVFGADGTNSIVARSSGLRKVFNREELLYCLESEFSLGQSKLENELHDINIVETYMLGGRGYGWIIPKGDIVNIGCGKALTELRDSRQLWDLFLKMVHKHGRFLKTEIPRPRGYSYRSLCGPQVKTHGERTILLGDAAGFANNLSGEGIWPAVRSGDFALPVVEHAFEIDDFGPETLSEYERAWKSEWWSTYRRNWRVLRLLSRFGGMHKTFAVKIFGDQLRHEGPTFDKLIELLKRRKDLYDLFSDLYLHKKPSGEIIPRLTAKVPSLALDYFTMSLKDKVNGEKT